MLKELLKGESGTNAVEYGLLMSLIVLGLIGVIQTFGGVVISSFYDLTLKLFTP
ncbi:MAG: Flp family type IVb pilin [Deltaproteobacteria bacterium]|nr:Flp family type IVb pilin [Deltaproteobacteria bacterium]